MALEATAEPNSPPVAGAADVDELPNKPPVGALVVEEPKSPPEEEAAPNNPPVGAAVEVPGTIQLKNI